MSCRPGVLSTLPASSRSGQQNSENPGFQIYQDGENSEEPEQFVPGGGGGKKIDSKNLPFRKNTERENDPSADKWTKSNVGNKKHSVPLDKIRAAPSFAVHQVWLLTIFYSVCGWWAKKKKKTETRVEKTAPLIVCAA